MKSLDFHELGSKPMRRPLHWWVNQNKTYQFEVPGGYMWSPKTKINKARNPFYDNMTETNPGDVVFSFDETYIKAVGIVTGVAETRIKPSDFNSVENRWTREGWFVPVEFTELEKPIRPKDHMDLIRPTLLEKYSPLQHNGRGNQGGYLYRVPIDMARVLITLLGGQVETILDEDPPEVTAKEVAEQRNAAITGYRAERYFIDWIRRNRPEWGDPIDRTASVGLGFDVEFTETDIKVEVKGCRSNIEDLRFTRHEWDTAKRLGDRYYLAIVSQLDTELPTHVGLVDDPYTKLSARQQKRLQVTYLIRRDSVSKFTE